MRTLLLMTALIVTLFSCKKNNDPDPQSNLNPWDGRYSISGTIVDATEPAISSPGPKEYSLSTGSATTDTLISKDLGFAAHLIDHGGSLSFYGTFGLILTFDPTTNKITSISNPHGQPSTSGRSAVLDPSGLNEFDPVTKTIKIKYWMDETGVAGHRTAFDETWTYLGPR